MGTPSPFVYENFQENYQEALQELKDKPAAQQMLSDLINTVLDMRDNLNSLEARVAALEP